MELLIAATMMSVLFIGLGGHLRGGITVWRQTTQRVDALQREHVALDRLERDLANSFVYGAPEESYGTEAGKLPLPQWTATSLAWYTVSSAVRPPSVRFVTYACEPHDGAAGLWGRSQSVGEARSGREPAWELILPECKTLRVRYAYAPLDETAALEWLEDWRYPEELPRLIEVTVGVSAGREFQRVMAIPQGSFKSATPPP